MMWLYYFLDISQSFFGVAAFMFLSGFFLLLASVITFYLSFETSREAKAFGELRAVSFITLRVAIMLFIVGCVLGVIKPSSEAREFLIEEIIKESVSGN